MTHTLNSFEIVNYHYTTTYIMLFIIVLFSTVGYFLNSKEIYRNKINIISKILIFFCIIQEILDHLNRFIWDSKYNASLQRDLPIHFCHIAFYFSIIAIYLNLKNNHQNKKSSMHNFMFSSAFLLGLSGALQGILTPDFSQIYNLLGVITAHLQHSLIILNVFWLLFAYGMKLNFKDILNTYLFINLIIPIAIMINKILGANSEGLFANYLYVSELPNVNNPIVNILTNYDFPYYLLFGQPILILYLLVLYLPFFTLKKIKNDH